MIQVDALTGQSLTYHDLFDLTKRLASALYKLGVRKGDVVAQFTPNNVHYGVIMYAVMCCGAIVTTANPKYTKCELLNGLCVCVCGGYPRPSIALQVQNRGLNHQSFLLHREGLIRNRTDDPVSLGAALSIVNCFLRLFMICREIA